MAGAADVSAAAAGTFPCGFLVANCQLLYWYGDFPAQSLQFPEDTKGCSIERFSLGMDSAFLLSCVLQGTMERWTDSFRMLLEFNPPVLGVPKFDFHQSANSYFAPI